MIKKIYNNILKTNLCPICLENLHKYYDNYFICAKTIDLNGFKNKKYFHFFIDPDKNQINFIYEDYFIKILDKTIFLLHKEDDVYTNFSHEINNISLELKINYPFIDDDQFENLILFS